MGARVIFNIAFHLTSCEDLYTFCGGNRHGRRILNVVLFMDTNFFQTGTEIFKKIELNIKTTHIKTKAATILN